MRDILYKDSDTVFCWVPLQQLQNGLKVYPLELVPHILANDPTPVHFVSREE